MKHIIQIISVLLPLLLGSCFVVNWAHAESPAETQSSDPQQTSSANALSFGVPPFVSSEYVDGIYQPLLDYIRQNSGYEVELKPLGNTYSEFLKGLTSQHFDVLVLPAHWSLAVINSLEYKPALRSRREFQALIFTHENSGVNSLQDLKGRTIATLNDASLAASVLRRVMQVQGINPSKHVDAYVYANSEDVVAAVRAEKNDVGVIIEIESNALDEEIAGNLKQIAKLSAGPAIILLSNKFSSEEAEMFSMFLQSFQGTEAAKAIPQAAAFDGFSPLTKEDLVRFKESEKLLQRFITPNGS